MFYLYAAYLPKLSKNLTKQIRSIKGNQSDLTQQNFPKSQRCPSSETSTHLSSDILGQRKSTKRFRSYILLIGCIK